MASDVQHCNMALSHLGSDARVSSISPPDGSVEAGHCATFYSQVRVEMLETGSWAFSLKRAALAQVTNESTAWAYAYTKPSDCLTAKRILRAASTVSVFTAESYADDNDSAEFEIEGGVLYTNEPDAVLVYVRDITDTTKFTPSFSSAFSYLLASYLAGPIIKGSEGMRVGDGMRQRAMSMASISATTAANASSSTTDFTPTVVNARA